MASASVPELKTVLVRGVGPDGTVVEKRVPTAESSLYDLVQATRRRGNDRSAEPTGTGEAAG
jgi:hypothetical protein